MWFRDTSLKWIHIEDFIFLAKTHNHLLFTKAQRFLYKKSVCVHNGATKRQHFNCCCQCHKRSYSQCKPTAWNNNSRGGKKNNNWQPHRVLTKLEQQKLSCQVASYLRRGSVDGKALISSLRRSTGVCERETEYQWKYLNIYSTKAWIEVHTSKLPILCVHQIKQVGYLL